MINRQLVKGRAELDDILSKKGLTAPTSSIILDMAVDFLAASLIALQPGAMNPTTNFKTEDFERTDGSKVSQADIFHTKGLIIIESYVSNNSTGLPNSYTVGRVGVRIGEYEEMSDSEEVDY